MKWWQKSGAVIILLFAVELVERLLDVVFGDGDGVITRFHLSLYITFLQLLLLIFMVNWLFQEGQETRRQIIISLGLTSLYFIPLIIFEVLFQVSRYYSDSIGFLSPLSKNYYQNNRKLIQFTRDCSKYDPELYYTLNPGICTFSSEYFSNHYEINSSGTRDDEQSLQEPEVIALGDSFTMGWGVDQNETFPQVIERETSLKVLNAGISSYGTAREYLLFKRLDRSNLKFVIVQYCFNDYEENRQFLQSDKSLDVSDEASFLDRVELNDLKYRYFPGKYVAYSLKYLTQEKDSILAIRSKEVELFGEILLDIQRESNGSLLLVIDLCSHINDTFNQNFSKWLETSCDSICSKEIIHVDMSGKIDQSFLLVPDEHLNVAGHEMVGKILIESIDQAKIGFN